MAPGHPSTESQTGATAMRAQGIDISVWQDDNSTPQMFDFARAVSKGISFAGIKVSQATWADPDYMKNWANAKPYVYRMPYHFLTWDVSARKQAETFWGLIEKDTWGVLPLICDFEWWKTVPVKAFDHLYAFLERMKQLTSLPLGIYTAKSFWDTYGSKDAYWTQYRLWQCWINAGEPPPVMPWNKWDFWQYTFKLPGVEYGAESKDLDGDYYSGTLEDLRKDYSLPELEAGTPISVPPSERSGLRARVLVNALNVRRHPGTEFPVVGRLNRGQIVDVVGVDGANIWYELPDGHWFAGTYRGVKYCEVLFDK